jgi:hypothetical protein
MGSLDKSSVRQCLEVAADGGDVDAEAEGEVSRLDITRLFDQFTDVPAASFT